MAPTRLVHPARSPSNALTSAFQRAALPSGGSPKSFSVSAAINTARQYRPLGRASARLKSPIRTAPTGGGGKSRSTGGSHGRLMQA